MLSTVRSLPGNKALGCASAKWVEEQLGALANPRLINVALTRARRAFCIIGNTETLEANIFFLRAHVPVVLSVLSATRNLLMQKENLKST